MHCVRRRGGRWERFRVWIIGVGALQLGLLPTQGMASEIGVSRAAIERAVEDQVFGEDGRHYIAGPSKCDYAYFEQPRVSFRDGRLWLVAHFTGRKAIEVAGTCIGPGDSFDVFLSARLKPDGGSIILAEVRVEHVNGLEAFSNAINGFLGLPSSVKFNIREDLEAALRDSETEPFDLSLIKLTISDLHLTEERVVVSVDIGLFVDVQ